MALTDNLFSYYKFDSGAITTDSAGSNTLTNNNTVAGSSSGKIGYGADYGSSGTTKSLSNTTGIPTAIGTGNFTINLWVKYASTPASNTQMTLFTVRVNGTKTQHEFDYRNESGTLKYNLWTGSTGGTEVKYTITESTATWYMLTLTYDGTNLRLYRNTSLILTRSTGTSTTTLNTVRLGNYPTDSRQLFGVMDEVGMWSRVLSSGEISTLYNSGNGAQYPYAAPTATTQAVSDITSTTATGNGNITADGGYPITERGVCWNTSTGPTTANSKATSAGTTGAFTASITSLSAGTLYYVRAYAINSVGTSYGSEVTFTTLAAPTVTTQAVSSIAQTTATGNGNITATGGVNAYQRGVATVPGASGDITFASIPNQSFEDGDPSTSWYYWNNGGTQSFSRSTTQVKYGTYSGKVITDGSAVYIAIQDIAVTAGKTYTFGMWVWSSTPTVYLAVQETSWDFWGSTRVAHSGNSTWEFLTVTKTISVGVTVLKAGTSMWGGTTGTVYMDGAILAVSPNSSPVTFTFDSGNYGTGAFTTSLTSLTANTAYRTTAFATNPVGTSYGATVGFSTSSLASGLISYYKLDESSGNAFDSVSTNTLTNNNTVGFSAGKINNGADFVRASAEYFNASSVVIPNGAKSVSFWYKGSDTTNNYGVISVGEVFSVNKNGFNVSGGNWVGGKLYIQLGKVGGEIVNFTTSANVTDGTFRLITVTWDGTTNTNAFKLYVNGVLDAQATATQTETDTPLHNLYVGYDPSAGYFGGSLDELGIWNRALTPTEVIALYNFTAGNQYPFTQIQLLNVKSYNTNLRANIKSINTNPIANVKSLNTNT